MPINLFFLIIIIIISFTFLKLKGLHLTWLK